MEDTFKNLKFFLFGDYFMCLWTGGAMVFIGWIFIQKEIEYNNKCKEDKNSRRAETRKEKKMKKVELLGEVEGSLEVGQVVQATYEEVERFNEVSGDSGQWLERVYHGEFQELDGEKIMWYEVHELTEE